VRVQRVYLFTRKSRNTLFIYITAFCWYSWSVYRTTFNNDPVWEC